MDQKYPMLIDRVQSIFIDVVLIIVLMFVFAALLDFLTIYMNPEKRAIHDFASGSVMICTGYVEPELLAEAMPEPEM